jgi:hypothetical protein
MKISVPDGQPVTVSTDMGDFTVHPIRGQLRLLSGKDMPAHHAVYATQETGSGSRRLSEEFPTDEQARSGFKRGFEVPDPNAEPADTVSKIVAAMLKDPRVRRSPAAV